MFDNNLKPWLLEINGNPSLNIAHHIDPEDENSERVISPIDKLIKAKVLEGAKKHVKDL